MHEHREQYPNAPLAIVTAEIRLGYEPAVKSDEVRDKFAATVRDMFPVLNNEQSVTFALQGPDGVPQVTQQPQIRATTLDGKATVALNPSSLSLSMDGASYTRYSKSLGPLMEHVVRALHEVAPSAVVERVGIRYIDEVRPPNAPEDIQGWSTWICSDLLAASHALPDAPARGFQSSTTFHPTPDRTVVFNCGRFEGVTVVDLALPFGRKKESPSAMFVLDVDSAWNPAGHTLLDATRLAEVLNDLHQPANTLFEWAITEEARIMFRGPRDA